MNNKLLMGLSIIVGILFIGLALMYFTTPAGSLPSYIPGYEAGVATTHFKHGLGSLILGLALFAFAWFQSGKKSISVTIETTTEEK